ncbi:YbaB/EbfC family nucleoid-associated protein, partial [Aeromonas hydrophila]
MAQEQEKLKEERIVENTGDGMVAGTVTDHKEDI